MKISASLLAELLDKVPANPPESGGIIGGNGDTVAFYALDSGIKTNVRCCYVPDVARLNTIIADWNSRGIEFMGIFHTHFYGVDALSVGDKAYISKIMYAIPHSIKKLYFPVVVFPAKELVVYAAVRNSGEINIVKEFLERIGG